MEIHAHTHTARKKWTHYLWEFLMLFLAVFCGFLAENIREHKIEKSREKQFIRSLLDDLQADLKSLEDNYQHHQASIVMLDSLFLLLDDLPLAKQHGDDLYYLARVGPRFIPFANNSKTFDQLKNAGGFRLISKAGVADQIMIYYLKFPLLRELETIYDHEFEDYKRIASKIIDPAVFRKQQEPNRNTIRGNNNPSLRTYDPSLLKEMGLWTIYLNGTRSSILRRNDSLRVNANELIRYLKREYRII